MPLGLVVLLVRFPAGAAPPQGTVRWADMGTDRKTKPGTGERNRRLCGAVLRSRGRRQQATNPIFSAERAARKGVQVLRPIRT